MRYENHGYLVAGVLGQLVINGHARCGVVESDGGEQHLLGLCMLNFEGEFVGANADEGRVHGVRRLAHLHQSNKIKNLYTLLPLIGLFSHELN